MRYNVLYYRPNRTVLSHKEEPDMIAFFDSGVGGITVLAQALRLIRNKKFLYYADTVNAPYGVKPKNEVREHIFRAADFIAEKNAEALVVACNTATSVAIEDLRKRCSFPVIGMEPAVKPAVKDACGRRVLVFATNLTLRESKFKDLVNKVDIRHCVDAVPLPGLVSFAEEMNFDPAAVSAYLKKEIAGLDPCAYGTVVLGCTHFPLFRKIIAGLFAPDVTIIDGAPGTVNRLQQLIQSVPLEEQTLEFYESGRKLNDTEAVKYHTLLKIAGENN